MNITDIERKKLYRLFDAKLPPKKVLQEMGWQKNERQKYYYHKKNWENYKSGMSQVGLTIDENIGMKVHTNEKIQLFMTSLNEEEKRVFLSEYTKLYKELDSLTDAEEQQLFTAVMLTILSARSLVVMTQEEGFYKDSIDGNIDPTDNRYRTEPNPGPRKDWESHVSQQIKLLEQLKMTRKQRLERVNAGKDNLVEIVKEMSNNESLAAISTRIVELADKSDEALKELLEKGHIRGYFESK